MTTPTGFKNKRLQIKILACQMSLFKSREWWSAYCGVNETFGVFHMCIANYELKQIIIVGSIEGYLRIFDPQPSSSETLQLETQLALPILAVETGRFNK